MIIFENEYEGCNFGDKENLSCVFSISQHIDLVVCVKDLAFDSSIVGVE